MHRAILLTALAAAAILPALARAAPPTRPNAPPPELITMQADRDGNLTALRTQTVYRTEERLVKAVVDGKEVMYKQTVSVPESVSVSVRYALKGLKAFDLDGLPIDAGKLPKLLEKKTTVIISPDGQPLDGFYRQFFKEETLVLVLPGNPGVTTPVPVPVPAPAVIPPGGAP